MILTFNYSVPENKSGVNLPYYPVQIMPFSRSRMSRNSVIPYPNVEKYNQSVLHISYICKPFGKNLLEPANRELLNIYRQLATKIKFDLLIHGPSNLFELNNYEIGMNIIRTIFDGFEYKVIVEVPTFNSGTKIDMREYLDRLIKEFPNDSFGICLDTAHLYANGCSTNDMIEIIQEYRDVILAIHLNGNENEQFKPDRHVEIFNPANKIPDVPKLMETLKTLDVPLIAEITRATYNYSDWKSFADRYEIPIVEFSEKLMINREKIL